MNKTARYARIATGALIWILAVTLSIRHLADPAGKRDLHLASDLISYLSYDFGRRETIRLQFSESVEIAVGDALFYRGPNESLIPVGEVRALLRDGSRLPLYHAYAGHGVREVECTLRPGSLDRLPGGLRARLFSVPETFSWVLRTLLPGEKIAAISEKWNQELLSQREEIFEILNPVISKFLQGFQEVLSADLPPALKARRAELGLIGKRLNDEIVEKEFKPLIKTELWPIIERRTKPALQVLSSEILKKAPLWGFTWRYIYQSLPFTSDVHLKRKFEEFWTEDAVPILKAHADQFLMIAKDIVKEAAGNPRLGRAFRKSFDRVMEDRDVQRLIRLVVQDVILDNPRFHQQLRDFVKSPEVAGALQSLSPRFEPLIRQVGMEILGTPQAGITPEFARVLRTQILKKDRRWLLLEWAPPGGAPPEAPAGPRPVVPAVVEGH